MIKVYDELAGGARATEFLVARILIQCNHMGYLFVELRMNPDIGKSNHVPVFPKERPIISSHINTSFVGIFPMKRMIVEKGI
ncbi:MAG: hypothetical protein AAB682_02035 [Patescibacteria group bacterium]